MRLEALLLTAFNLHHVERCFSALMNIFLSLHIYIPLVPLF